MALIHDHPKALSRLRGAAGLTQTELAKRICRSRASVNAMETGRKTPTIEDIEVICKVLGCSTALYMFLCTRSRMQRKRFQEGEEFTLLAREMLNLAMRTPQNKRPALPVEQGSRNGVDV